MKPLDIKAEIIRRGLSITDIANEAGATVSEVSRCISGDGLYLRIREIIARRIGKKVADVFAENHPQSKGNYPWCRTS